MRIDPAVTFSPPYALTPSLLELESRPFLVDPVPFLCAISNLVVVKSLVNGGYLAVCVLVTFEAELDFSASMILVEAFLGLLPTEMDLTITLVSS